MQNSSLLKRSSKFNYKDSAISLNRKHKEVMSITFRKVDGESTDSASLLKTLKLQFQQNQTDSASLFKTLKLQFPCTGDYKTSLTVLSLELAYRHKICS